MTRLETKGSPLPSLPRREFRFTSEVPICLDYHGKHVTVDQVVSSSIPQERATLYGSNVWDQDSQCVSQNIATQPVLLPTGHFHGTPNWPGPAQLLRAEAQEALLPAWVSSQPLWGESATFPLQFLMGRMALARSSLLSGLGSPCSSFCCPQLWVRP